MEKRDIINLVGQVIDHKKLGLCEVLEIANKDEGKFVGKVIATGEIKKFVFSDQFFNNVEDYQTVNVKVAKKVEPSRVHKKVDMDKYRNHPLVKKIDQLESGYRARQLYEEENLLIVEDPEDEEEISE